MVYVENEYHSKMMRSIFFLKVFENGFHY